MRRIGCIVLLVAVAGIGHARADVAADWRKQMAIRLNSNKGLTPGPPGQSGAAKVGFVIDRTGKLVSSWLAESAGIAALDEHALAIVERSQPFPMPPPEVDDDHLRLIVPFIFQPWPEPGGYGGLEQENAAVNAKMRSICRGC